MPRVIGIDPGTVSIDLCRLDDGHVFLDQSLPTPEALSQPSALMALLDEVHRARSIDLVAGPSGYGLPLVPIEAVGEAELRLLFLAQPGEQAGVHGLRTLVGLLRDARLPVVFTPGVVHLTTVPTHRKPAPGSAY